MANWEAFRVSDIVTRISDNEFVLPVIQRRLVWNEEKMELLFDTLLKGNSFGGVICIEEEKGSVPLFSFRPFTKDGNAVDSVLKDVLNQSQMFVIDGQQRLQSFYIGLLGSYNGKEMYFDLFSDFKNLDYSFKFENDESKLPKIDSEREGDSVKEQMWYPAKDLFKRLKDTNDEDQVAEEIIKSKNVLDELKKNHVMKNVKVFYKNIFSATNIGISKINVNKSLDLNANRQRIVELFRRLNDGGTKLSSYDLVASILKGFDWKMEKFLDDILIENDDIGLTQDTLINLLFILRDTPMKQMVEIDAEDAEFATKYYERIQQTMRLLKKFLKAAGLYNYYLKERNRSYIPLYFIAYNIFYKKPLDQQLGDMFNTFDTNDTNFRKLYIWMYKSLINGVFSRGCGWIPYKTGIKKIAAIVKQHKYSDFPTEQVFMVYRSHPLYFYDNIDVDKLSQLDRDIIFYMIYDNQSVIREQDIDHIHPVNILSSNGVSDYEINTIANYQLLDSGTNRGLKNGKPLSEWVSNCVQNKAIYLQRHLIPENPDLWDFNNYRTFLEERKKLIASKINKKLAI